MKKGGSTRPRREFWKASNSMAIAEQSSAGSGSPPPAVFPANFARVGNIRLASLSYGGSAAVGSMPLILTAAMKSPSDSTNLFIMPP